MDKDISNKAIVENNDNDNDNSNKTVETSIPKIKSVLSNVDDYDDYDSGEIKVKKDENFRSLSKNSLQSNDKKSNNSTNRSLNKLSENRIHDDFKEPDVLSDRNECQMTKTNSDLNNNNNNNKEINSSGNRSKISTKHVTSETDLDDMCVDEYNDNGKQFLDYNSVTPSQISIDKFAETTISSNRAILNVGGVKHEVSIKQDFLIQDLRNWFF